MKKGRIGAAFPGRNPAAPVAGGEGKVGEELEETELYPFVGSNEVGDGRRCAPRGEQWAAATAGRGGGAPARGNGSGVVWELHQAMEKLARGLARVEEGRKGELRGGAWAAAMGCRGGSGLVALGGGKRFGEHRWRPRKLATGSFGREEGWRRGLRGDLEGGGGHGGGGGRSWQQGLAGRGARAQEGRRTSRERL